MSSWVRLADIRESFLLEVAEYTKGNGIIEDPVFVWWFWNALQKKMKIAVWY